MQRAAQTCAAQAGRRTGMTSSRPVAVCTPAVVPIPVLPLVPVGVGEGGLWHRRRLSRRKLVALRDGQQPHEVWIPLPDLRLHAASQQAPTPGMTAATAMYSALCTVQIIGVVRAAQQGREQRCTRFFPRKKFFSDSEFHGTFSASTSAVPASRFSSAYQQLTTLCVAHDGSGTALRQLASAAYLMHAHGG